MKIKTKIWLSGEDSEGIFGPGRLRLLTKIDSLGSLKLAAEELKISYKKAWLDIKKAEEKLGLKLTEKTRGGNDRGHTVLTGKGREFIQAFQAMSEEVSAFSSKCYAKYKKKLRG